MGRKFDLESGDHGIPSISGSPYVSFGHSLTYLRDLVTSMNKPPTMISHRYPIEVRADATSGNYAGWNYAGSVLFVRKLYLPRRRLNTETGRELMGRCIDDAQRTRARIDRALIEWRFGKYFRRGQSRRMSAFASKSPIRSQSAAETIGKNVFFVRESSLEVA